MSPTATPSYAVSIERGVATALLAAVTWIALGLESIVRPRPENYRDLLWIVPFFLTAAAFWFMHQVQRGAGRRFEGASFAVVIAATVLAFAGNMGVLFRVPVLAVLGFPLGALLWTAGLVLFGVATIRAGVFPRYVGTSLVLLEPLAIVTGLALSPIAPLQDHGAYSAGVEKGVALALVAVGFLAIRNELRASALLR